MDDNQTTFKIQLQKTHSTIFFSMFINKKLIYNRLIK